MTRVKIIKPLSRGLPVWVRVMWIGLEVPYCYRTVDGGYGISWREALDTLAQKDMEAAKQWAGYPYYDNGVFDKECCELILD